MANAPATPTQAKPQPPAGRPSMAVRQFRDRPLMNAEPPPIRPAPLRRIRPRPPLVSAGQLFRVTMLVLVGLVCFDLPRFDPAQAEGGRPQPASQSR